MWYDRDELYATDPLAEKVKIFYTRPSVSIPKSYMPSYTRPSVLYATAISYWKKTVFLYATATSYWKKIKTFYTRPP